MKRIVTLLTSALLFSISTIAIDEQFVKQDPPAKKGKVGYREILVGHWTGSRSGEGKAKLEWITTHSLDGKFEIRFRSTDNAGKIEESIETGFWGASGNIFFTSIQKTGSSLSKLSPVDHRDPTYDDAYEIVSLEGNDFKYKNLDTGRIFTSRKVSKDYKF